jgi:type IV secretion system protein VirD4
VDCARKASVGPEGALDRRNHWEKTSHSLPVGTILHVLYAEPDKTPTGVANFLSDPARTIERTLQVMMTAAHAEGIESTAA